MPVKVLCYEVHGPNGSICTEYRILSCRDRKRETRRCFRPHKRNGRSFVVKGSKFVGVAAENSIPSSHPDVE